MDKNWESLGDGFIRRKRKIAPIVRCDKCTHETTFNINNIVKVKGNVYKLCETCANYLNYELLNGRQLGMKLDLSLIKQNEGAE